MAVVVDLVVIAVLVVLGAVFTHERPRVWLWQHVAAFAERHGRPEHTAEWEREHTELWLMARRRQLLADLRRIESLLLHDDTMSATRQLGNRLARDQLRASLARIPDLLPARDRYAAYETVAPTAYDTPAPSPALAGRARTVEVLDVGGWR